MLVPTVASALVFWNSVARDFDIDITRVGLNMEFGHSEMVGLDHVHDVVEQLENNAMMHIHLNSQGYNDGIIFGGPGKFDIDHGTRINGMNIAIARLMQDAGYNRWKGHDMQPRPYDSTEQAVDRVVRSILSWEACEFAARNLDLPGLEALLAARETAKVEDCMRKAVGEAQGWFDEHYR
jgi:xylose isomerase